MKTYEELCAEMDEFLDSLSPEELCRQLMSYGMKFENPPPPIE